MCSLGTLGRKLFCPGFFMNEQQWLVIAIGAYFVVKFKNGYFKKFQYIMLMILKFDKIANYLNVFICYILSEIIVNNVI